MIWWWSNGPMVLWWSNGPMIWWWSNDPMVLWWSNGPMVWWWSNGPMVCGGQMVPWCRHSLHYRFIWPLESPKFIKQVTKLNSLQVTTSVGQLMSF
jgi:hypothetical protein